MDQKRKIKILAWHIFWNIETMKYEREKEDDGIFIGTLVEVLIDELTSFKTKLNKKETRALSLLVSTYARYNQLNSKDALSDIWETWQRATNLIDYKSISEGA